MFPANERGTRHSHLPEESDVFRPLIGWRPPKSPRPACWDLAVKRSVSPAPLGQAPFGEDPAVAEAAGRLPMGAKKINEPSMFCVFSRASLERVSLGTSDEPSWLSLGGPQSRTCERQFGVNFGRSPERSRSRGQGQVFPANERGTRHSHLPEESDVFRPLIGWRPPKSPSPACWDLAVKRSVSLSPAPLGESPFGEDPAVAEAAGRLPMGARASLANVVVQRRFVCRGRP